MKVSPLRKTDKTNTVIGRATALGLVIQVGVHNDDSVEFLVSGKTIIYKDFLKKHGAKWDADNKQWSFDDFDSLEVGICESWENWKKAFIGEAIVNAAKDVFTFGENHD